MTTKAEFNAEEWDKIAEGPALAGLIVISSQRGGTIRETMAMAKVYAAAQKEHSAGDLVGELVQSAPAPRRRSSSRARRTCAPAASTRSPRRSALVEAKATPEELADYREFSMNVAQHAAEADKSGGFLGIGGERVTGDEQAALSDVAAALGTEAPPASPAS